MKFTCVLSVWLLCVFGFTSTDGGLALNRHAGGGRSGGGHSLEKREVPVAADLRNTPCAPNDYFKIECNTCYCNMERSGYLCTENFCHKGGPVDSEIKLSNDTKVVISNGDVKLIVGNETTLTDNSLARFGKNKDIGVPREITLNRTLVHLPISKTLIQVQFNKTIDKTVNKNTTLEVVPKNQTHIIEPLQDVKNKTVQDLTVANKTIVGNLTVEQLPVKVNQPINLELTIVANTTAERVSETTASTIPTLISHAQTNSSSPGNSSKLRNAFSCVPGQSFKKECNMCDCTPDGKNAICTQQKCDLDAAPTVALTATPAPVVSTTLITAEAVNGTAVSSAVTATIPPTTDKP